MSEIVTAGILVIGDEILSGRTKDKNIGFIAEYLTNIGIDLKEVRVVSDDEPDIIAALDALPAVVREVAGRVPVLFDSGIRRGADIFKAVFNTLNVGVADVVTDSDVWHL